MKDEKITLTMEQFDDALKQWKRKGAERSLGFAMAGAVPLVVLCAFSSDASLVQIAAACATYYCAVVALSVFTQ